MSDERKRKKRSEKLSDSFIARLAREIGPSTRLDAIAARDAARSRESGQLTSMQSPAAVGFTRCPHCREFVPRRESCRACGALMT